MRLKSLTTILNSSNGPGENESMQLNRVSNEIYLNLKSLPFKQIYDKFELK